MKRMMTELINSVLRASPAWRAAFVLLLIVVSYLALTPHPPQGLSTGWDKSNHALAFASLLVSCRLAWPRQRAWVIVLALLAYGGLIEIVQTQVPGRDGDLLDMFADSVGLALGLAVHALLGKMSSPRA